MTESRERNESGQYSGTLSEEQVLHAVSSTEHVATTSEVAEALDKSIDTARRWLNRLHDDGRVHKKKVGARGVVWWTEGDDDDSEDPPVKTLQDLSRQLDDTIFVGNTEFEDGTVRPRNEAPMFLDSFTEKTDEEARLLFICSICDSVDETSIPKRKCRNCDSGMTGHLTDDANDEMYSDGWRDMETDTSTGRDLQERTVVRGEGICPDCASAGEDRVQQAKEEGFMDCDNQNHTRHRPGSNAFDDCRGRGKIPLTDEQYEEVLDACS